MKTLTRQQAEIQSDAALAVENSADDQWKSAAWDRLIDYLRTHETFHADDFWKDTTLAEPREGRALGPVVKKALREGLMEHQGAWRPSIRSNLSPKRVYASLVFEGK